MKKKQDSDYCVLCWHILKYPQTTYDGNVNGIPLLIEEM